MKTVAVTFRASAEAVAAWRTEAERRGQRLSAWLAMAAERELARGARYVEKREEERKTARDASPLHPSGWPKASPCPWCGGKHDPAKHPNSDEALRQLMQQRGMLDL